MAPVEGVPFVAPPPIVRRNLADAVYESITAMVMNHQIAPDEKVSIDHLARELNVSHTPIREALSRLESDGLVRKEALRGFYTTSLLDPDRLRDLYAFRGLIEPWAAAQAAGRVTPGDAARLTAEIESAPVAPGDDDYNAYKELTDHDNRFHQLVLDIAGNAVVAEAFARTHCHLHLFRLHFGSPMARTAVAEHQEIATAIAEHDPTRAQAAMSAHLDASYQRLEEATR